MTIKDIFIDSGAWSLFRIHVMKDVAKMGRHGRMLEAPEKPTTDFTYYNLAKGTPFREYCDLYASFIKTFQDRIDFFANVDAIGNPDVTREIQRFFEEEHGIKPIPVVHRGSNLKYLDYYLEKGYPVIGLGGFASGMGGWTGMREWCDNAFLRLCPASNNYLPLVKVHGFAMTGWKGIRRWPWYCMTEDHQVLTRQGWKKRDQIKTGQEILAFDKGQSKWQKVLEVPTFELEKDNIHILSNRNCEARVTANHRWVVLDRNEQYRTLTTEEMMQGRRDFRIPRRATYTDFPTIEKYSDEAIELLAWFWTDGTHRHSKGRTPSIGIYQSERANPKKVKAIRDLLNRTGGPWNENPSHPEGMRQFEVRGLVVDEVLQIAPLNKEFSLDFILSLTKRQLKLFITTVLQGDGGYWPKLIREKGFEISQSKGRNLEVFRIALILAGYSTSQYGDPENMVTVRTSSVPSVYSLQLTHTQQPYSGKVWCVRVESGSFFTRCNGHVYVTGNSVDSTSWSVWPANGWLPIPRWTERTGFRFDVAPYVINVCPTSKTRFRRDHHVVNIRQHAKVCLYKWLDHCELIWGSCDAEGKAIEKGVCSDHEERRTATVRYFQGLEASLPEWPWPLDPKIRQRHRKKTFNDIRKSL